MSGTAARKYLSAIAAKMNPLGQEFCYRLARLSLAASCFRAGMLVFTRVDGRVCLLLVAQTSSPRYWGPPKGSAERTDVSAMATAIRELEEETGLDYGSGQPGSGTIVISRWPQDPTEYLMYFTVFYADPPEINLQVSELSDYRWVPVDELGGFLSRVSTPTSHVFHILGQLTLVLPE